jgi:hypothetical protein
MARVNLRPLRATPLLAVLLAALAGFPTAQPVDAASVDSLRLRATYDVVASFSWASRAVNVKTTVQVSNPTAGSVETVAFNLATLRIGNAHVGVVTVDGNPVSETIDDQTVLVPFSPQLAAGDSASVVINYSATLSSRSDGDYWSFARLDGVMTAYRWIPWLSRDVRFNRPSVGEPWVTPSSSSVRVTITTDRTLKIASSGRRVSGNGLTQTFEARNVRDFNFSAAPDYRTASRTTRGTRITFFYRTMSPSLVLDWAVKAFKSYSNKVGAYPQARLNIAEIGPWADIESPSLFWLSSNLKRRLIPWTVAHEVAHQWFYSVVGNDQAREPFADEAVVDFMARDLVDSWVSSLCPQGDLDQTIYDLGNCYPWVIYVQGNLYLRSYRADVGAVNFWRGLANYYAAHRFGMGGTRQLLDALDAAAGINYPHYKRFPSLY